MVAPAPGTAREMAKATRWQDLEWIAVFGWRLFWLETTETLQCCYYKACDVEPLEHQVVDIADVT